MRVVPGAIAALLAAFLHTGCGRAGATEPFVLDEHDQLIAEAPGCEADCRRQGSARICMLKDPACRAVCKELPECKPAGERLVRACAVVRGR